MLYLKFNTKDTASIKSALSKVINNGSSMKVKNISPEFKNICNQLLRQLTYNCYIEYNLNNLNILYDVCDMFGGFFNFGLLGRIDEMRRKYYGYQNNQYPISFRTADGDLLVEA